MTLRARLRVSLLALLVASGGAVAVAQQALPPSPADTAPLSTLIPRIRRSRSATLPNGLRYYIRANRKPEKRAELRLVVNAGSVLEDEDQRGLAHFVEHMAFNGTAHFPKMAIVTFMQSLGMRFGAHVNAQTSFDETHVHAPRADRQARTCSTSRCSSSRTGRTTVTFDPGGDREGARRRHGGMAARPRRRRADAGQAAAGAAQGLALRGSAADRHAPTSSSTRSPSAQAASTTTGTAPISWRSSRSATSTRPPSRRDQAALRLDSGGEVAEGRGRLRRARPRRHALRDHHRQGSDDDDGRASYSADAGAADQDDHRRLPAADRRGLFGEHALGAAGRDARRSRTRRSWRAGVGRGAIVRATDEASILARSSKDGGIERGARRAVRRGRIASRASASRRRNSIAPSRTCCATYEQAHDREGQRAVGELRRGVHRATSSTTSRCPASSTSTRCISGSCRRSRSRRSTRSRRTGRPTRTASSSSARPTSRASTMPTEATLAAVMTTASRAKTDGLRGHRRRRRRCSRRHADAGNDRRRPRPRPRRHHGVGAVERRQGRAQADDVQGGRDPVPRVQPRRHVARERSRTSSPRETAAEVVARRRPRRR